jgi:PhzF family phenazine biosynthesis protein
MRIRIIDAFTDQPFAGNPAGVCLLDEVDDWPDDGWMHAVAAELNLSETAFARATPGDEDADWALRWFTPTVEVDLCGHATLATAHALREDDLGGEIIRFATRSGVLTARQADDGAITLDFPIARLTKVAVPDGLVTALGVQPIATVLAEPIGYLIAELPDEQTVRALTPAMGALRQLAARGGPAVVVATAATPEATGYDYVSRVFAPAWGVPEDPVTGSAHTGLAPYWSQRLGAAELTARQISARGGTMRTVAGQDRVLMTGHAVTVLDGQLRPRP